MSHTPTSTGIYDPSDRGEEDDDASYNDYWLKYGDVPAAGLETLLSIIVVLLVYDVLISVSVCFSRQIL